MFDEADRNGDNYIGIDEFQHVLKSTNLYWYSKWKSFQFTTKKKDYRLIFAQIIS